MIRMMRGLAAGAALALMAVSGGCAGYGWEDGYGGGGWGTPSEVRGQVEGVQTRLNTIQLRRDNGRRAVVHFDSRTEVVSEGRRSRPESLDRGDYVSMRVSRDSRGRLYTRHVTVRHEVRDVYRGDRDRDRVRDRDRDRRRDDGRYEDRRGRGDDRYDARSVEGRVGRVDRAGRRFELRSDRGTVWVTVAPNASRGVRERFQRLRTGDRVGVTGRYVGRDRFQMERFR
ncbi:MAG TPA: hypothetical protein VF006_27900 [Longimicrobium sp.]